MMTPHAIVERLVEYAPALIRRAYARSGVDSRLPHCMNMAAIAFHTLRHCGVASEPIDTIASAWNHHFVTWLATGVDHPNAYQHTNDPMVLASLVSRDERLTHCVVSVPATRQIVDLACWQLASPSRGIQLPAALALPWDGQRAEYATATGATVQYRPWPAALYPAPAMDSRPDWINGPTAFGPLAKAIARRIRGRSSVLMASGIPAGHD